VLVGCAAVARDTPGIVHEPSLDIADGLPPAPETWPPYPRFPERSCWSRPSDAGMLRWAPSFAPRPGAAERPEELTRRLLDRFGDGRFVHRIELGAPPPETLRRPKAYYGGAWPPADALWATVVAPAAHRHEGELSEDEVRDRMLAGWQAALVAGALRDELCAVGGRPLVGWTVGPGRHVVSERVFALGQRFPNPSPRAFRERVELVGRRHGFRVVSLRLLRPLQLAPLLVVETDRDREQFVGEVAEIVALLDPRTGGEGAVARTFEGFVLEARDREATFVVVNGVNRGTAMSSQWSWDPCVMPYAHSRPIGAECP
jgi:hypothetical protein